MSIEYLAGIQPGAKIDLSRFGSRINKSEKVSKTPESYLPELKSRLYDLSGRINAEYGDILADNGQIKMAGSDFDHDCALIAAKEQGFAADCRKSVKEMAIDREKNPANIAEIAVTLLFDKVLRDDFIIMRASVYDDYENSADQLIIDKKTGAIICGFDEAILGSFDKGDGSKKKLKIDNKMKRGGAEIKYGVALRDSGLERAALKHIPIFYFNLDKADMKEILPSLADGSNNITPQEYMIYNQLVDSLSKQITRYGADTSLNQYLQSNLRAFAPSLDKMKGYNQAN